MRYLLFGGECYYARGGAHDLLGSGNSSDDLIKSEALNARDIEWWHVYDTVERKIVCRSEAIPHG